MQTTFIVNGKVQLVLNPDNSHDETLLKELLNQGELEIIPTSGAMSILDKKVSNSVIVRPKTLNGNDRKEVESSLSSDENIG